MTKYTVAVNGDEGPSARSTEVLDDALDWFTNAVTEVLDPAEPAGDLVTFASLSIGGKLHAVVQADGLTNAMKPLHVVEE